MKLSLKFYLVGLAFVVTNTVLSSVWTVFLINGNDSNILVASSVTGILSWFFVVYAIALDGGFDLVKGMRMAPAIRKVQMEAPQMFYSSVLFFVYLVATLVATFSLQPVVSLLSLVAYLFSYILSAYYFKSVYTTRHYATDIEVGIPVPLRDPVGISPVMAEDVVGIDVALERLLRMYRSGVLTREEYNLAKRLVISEEAGDKQRHDDFHDLLREQNLLIEEENALKEKRLRQKQEDADAELLDQLQNKHEELNQRLVKLLADREEVDSEEGEPDPEDVGVMIPAMGKKKKPQDQPPGTHMSVGSIPKDLLEGDLDHDMIDNLLFGDDGGADALFNIADLEQDPLLARNMGGGKGARDGANVDATTAHLSVDCRLTFETNFLAVYYRNERSRMQCFPFCSEFGDYATMKTQGASHKKNLKGCHNSVQVSLSVPGLVQNPGKTLLVLGRIADLSTIQEEFSFRGRIVDKDILETLISQGHFILGKVKKGQTQQDSRTSLVVEFKPPKNSWTFHGKLEKRKAGKKTKDQSFMFDVLTFCEVNNANKRTSVDSGAGASLAAQLRRMSRASSTNSVQPLNGYGLLLRSHSPVFAISTTRKLNKKKK